MTEQQRNEFEKKIYSSHADIASSKKKFLPAKLESPCTLSGATGKSEIMKLINDWRRRVRIKEIEKISFQRA